MSTALEGSRRLVPPSNAKCVRTERGEIACWQIAADIVATRVQGVMTREMSQLAVSLVEPVYASANPVICFSDWLEMSNYDSACRTDLTAWLLRRRDRTVMHVAVRSRLVAMGVTVANLALGGVMRVHNTAQALDDALDEALAKKQR